MRLSVAFLFGILLLGSSSHAESAKEIEMKVIIPNAGVHRPYVAIWLEDDQRKAVATIALWWQKDTWLKDLRQWWRKSGREPVAGVDAFSGATRKAGDYTIRWAPVDAQGKALAPGKYILNFEASREEGGRDHAKQEIELGKAQEFKLAASKELGEIIIKIPAL